ncbi:MAG: M48 family metallopeptidase [Gammaproteobacteria bacterium]
MNVLTLIFLLAIILSVSIQWYLIQRHISHIHAHTNEVPDAFRDRIPLHAHQKAARYTQAKVRTGLIEFIIGFCLLIAWTLAGALQFMDEFWRKFGMGEILTGVAFILSVTLISSLLDVPMSIYRTFGLEQKFGFNKTTVKTYINDLLKNTLLLLLIGTPMITLVLWIMAEAGPLWWGYVWLTWFAFSLFMMWAYPAFIAPLFNKFRPLENDDLKKRIENLLSRNGFASQGIFVMDGSTRSAHGNAYFTGLGANKRIVFFDTLIDELTHDEVEAVLAHELGHFKCHHIKKRIVLMGTVFFFGLAILGWLIDMPWFYQGLGVKTQSTYMALTLFVMIAPVFTFFLQPLFSWLSRKHEFEADDFAARQAHTNHLIQALVKLYKENANTLTPDPIYSAFHDSHPPAPIRIAHLSAKLA